ncbi:MAG: LysM peptidoglycan-binding domain-containing protein, partial [Polyangiaceae bacterium]|nr:LysM peptidoglycan-binding domain-containing protein [Polyangiaceae bacterium]
LKFIEFFRDDPKGRMLFASYLKRSAKYRETISDELRKKNVPVDLMWLVMVESGFEVKARSSAGAMGPWQFMAETGKLYGLRVDRWLDERMDVPAATRAAADYLFDLYKRLGNWDLALAGYNYGYVGVVNAIRKFNTNDFWQLAQTEGGLPWETSLYVPKMHALAVMAKNPKLFGFEAPNDATPNLDTVRVRPGTAFQQIALWAGTTKKEIDDLNPEYRASRTPPPEKDAPEAYVVRVPASKGALVEVAMAKAKLPPLPRTISVKLGDTPETLAAENKITVAQLTEANDLRREEVLRPGTTLIVPDPKPVREATAVLTHQGSSLGATAPAMAATLQPNDKPVVTIPDEIFVYPDRRRLFYRIAVGDTLVDVASAFHVTLDDLSRWNKVDMSARLQEGMVLQVFPPSGSEIRARALEEKDVRILVVGSDDFYSYWESLKGRRRVVLAARTGDTLESLAKEYALEAPSLERINHRNKKSAYREGDLVVLYIPQATPIRHTVNEGNVRKLPPLVTESAKSEAPKASLGALVQVRPDPITETSARDSELDALIRKTEAVAN